MGGRKNNLRPFHRALMGMKNRFQRNARTFEDGKRRHSIKAARAYSRKEN